MVGLGLVDGGSSTRTNFTQLKSPVKRITQDHIAQALGVSRSTVSKALKGDPAVARATVEKVRRTAEELGFVPDPMLAALAAYRKRRQPAAYHATLAWIYNHPRRESMEPFAGYADYFSGARDRARELGYELEPHWIGGRPGAARALERVLQARGIRGVIIAPQADPARALPLAWERYAAIAIGYTLKAPEIDRVTNDHFATMTGLLEKLHQRGYRRLGCYLWETDNERMGQRAGSAFLAVSREYQCRVRLYAEFQGAEFVRWVRQFQFDGVVCRADEALKALALAGIAVPADLGVAGYAVGSEETAISGMQHNNWRIGASAAEWVSAKLQRGEWGLSEYPRRLLIPSQWLENRTLRAPHPAGESAL